MKVLKGLSLGQKVFSQGAEVPISMVVESLPELLALGSVRISPPPHPSGYYLLLKDLPEGSKFEVLHLEDIPRVYIVRSWVIELDDSELTELHSCGACPRAFFTKDALLKHKRETGHRRPYGKKRREDEEENT